MLTLVRDEGVDGNFIIAEVRRLLVVKDLLDQPNLFLLYAESTTIIKRLILLRSQHQWLASEKLSKLLWLEFHHVLPGSFLFACSRSSGSCDECLKVVCLDRFEGLQCLVDGLLLHTLAYFSLVDLNPALGTEGNLGDEIVCFINLNVLRD